MISATNKMQQSCFDDSFKLALNVSGNSFAHLQEHFVLDGTEFHPICVTGRQQTAESVLCSIKLYIQSKCSWRWTKLSPETCRASLKESTKQMLLHPFCCWYQCTSDARSHKRHVNKFWYFADRASQYIYLNINKLNALNFIMSLLHASTCFEQTCLSSGGQNCTMQPLVSSHL